MDGWSAAVLVFAAFVAVSTLVGLMIGRRNQLLAVFRSRMVAARRAKQFEPEPELVSEQSKEAA
jgi:hypothetical protein